jgi:hypothetical protein
MSKPFSFIFSYAELHLMFLCVFDLPLPHLGIQGLTQLRAAVGMLCDLAEGWKQVGPDN